MLVNLVTRAANVGLRALAMGSRFALAIVLARLLTPAEVGLYGLFVATVGFSMLVIGGDFYTYSQRELLSEPRERWSFVLQHQALATLLLYAVLLPMQAAVFWLDLLPSHLAPWFFVLLFLEHLAQEINRVLIAMRRQLVASLVLFLRMGAWIWCALALMWLEPDNKNLNTVYASWFGGCVAAIVVGGITVWREAAPWRVWTIDKAWILRGLKTGLLFLLATMSFRALQTADRYAVDFLAGGELLGVYVLYIGMAMAVISVLDPAVFSYLYPRLVSAFRSGEYTQYRKLMRELLWSSAVVSIVAATMVGVLAPYVLSWVDKPVYTRHLHVLWLLLGMTVIYALSMVPHYGLYARGADKHLVIAHVSALLVFGIVVALAAGVAPLSATPIALVSAFTWMGIFKTWCYCRLRKGATDSIIPTAKHGAVTT